MIKATQFRQKCCLLATPGQIAEAASRPAREQVAQEAWAHQTNDDRQSPISRSCAAPPENANAPWVLQGVVCAPIAGAPLPWPMLRLRRPARRGLRRLLRPRQNDRVSRRIKSQRSSDKPAWDNALLHRAETRNCRRVASAPRLQGRNHSLICRPVMNACGSRHPAMTNAIKEIIRTM